MVNVRGQLIKINWAAEAAVKGTLGLSVVAVAGQRQTAATCVHREDRAPLQRATIESSTNYQTTAAIEPTTSLVRWMAGWTFDALIISN